MICFSRCQIPLHLAIVSRTALIGGGCSFFWIRGDTFPNRKENCSFVIWKNSLYATTSPTSSSNLLTSEKRPSPLSGKSIVPCKIFDYVFEAFPRLHRAKGPNKERQHNWPIIRPRFRKFATLHLLRDKLITHAVISATTNFNLQCNNVAR